MRIKYVEILWENFELICFYMIVYKIIFSVENVFLFVYLNDGMMGIGCVVFLVGVIGEFVDDSVKVLWEIVEFLLWGVNIVYFFVLIK